MGMESVYKLSVILNLVDNLSGQMNSVQSSVSGSVDKLNSAFGTMQKAGVAMAGIGGTITGLAMKTVTATFDTQNALGELSSLGVKDLKAVEDAAKSFSNTWAGTSKADFITASYDIKSGIASLTDEGVAQFTQLAALTGKPQNQQRKRWAHYLPQVTVSIKVFMMICLTLSLVRCSPPELQQQLRTTRHPAPRWQVRYQH